MLTDINSTFYSWIRGGVFLLLVSNFVIFLKNRESLVKYFSLYLLGIFIYLLKGTIHNSFFQSVFELTNVTLCAFSCGFYLNFIRVLHNSKEEYPQFDRVAKSFKNQLFILGVLFLVVNLLFGYDFLLKTLVYVVPIYVTVVIVVLAKTKIIVDNEGVYSLVASWFFFAMVIITVLKDYGKMEFLNSLELHPMFFVFVGIIVQTIIYTFLIADTIQRVSYEKNSIELNLARKTAQLYELKMTAFKNQLNPHFLFNSLNSINNYVIQNKKELASDYITKFAKLIRKVLQTTEEVTISLEEELKTAELYIKLEQSRLRNSFHYKIFIEDSIKVNQIGVVPLFTQPFIENSIWHGLSLKQDGELLINVLDREDLILVEVIDNGSGLSNKSKKTKEHKSYGIDTVKNRMNLVYGEENVRIFITDLADRDELKGTKVTILFPKTI
ncbi:Histidine kinase-, DNA gyrase B-, and HSP90-like ATPase [Tenacibaculum sp. 190130A14a]|uniref:Histidine kinase-, DNA gyrase B-, and HSP90-like ATPase n=1 Tax=Tenacibaculum polynesiense TaxID=3137857 RepID=A0ABM9PEH3_9FLAO